MTPGSGLTGRSAASVPKGASGDVPGAASGGEPLLAFRSGGRLYSVPIAEVREAARVPRLTPLPGASSRCAGLALVRGTPVAVVDPARETAPPPSESGARRFLIVLESRPFALLVDAVDGVTDGSAALALDLDALARSV